MKHTEEVAFTTLPLDGAEPELEEKRNSKHTAEGSSNERFSTLTASTTFSPYTCIRDGKSVVFLTSHQCFVGPQL
jgi:hypothetical protein